MRQGFSHKPVKLDSVRDKANTIRGYLILLVIVAITLSFFWKTASPRPFFYDEADYMYAGTRGFVANYLDEPSISVFQFVSKGLELSRDASRRSDISQFVRSSGDITFYRHYHGPVYAYWIALCHALGASDAAAYRGSGLILHFFTTSLIFWMFRLTFPASPPIAAFVAAVSFLLNRTALVSSTTVTQHLMYTFWAAVTLFLAALFFRTERRPYWYAACAALGISFATVESSFVLVGLFLILLVMLGRQIGWRPIPRLLGRGTLCFLLAVLVVWPKGVLQLGALKGYGYLAYMALLRKTFTPIGPVQLWTFKFTEYPEEFIIPVAALIAAAIFCRRMPEGRPALPFILYGFFFIGVTMVITLPYTYYHDSLLMSTAVVIGVVFGWLWQYSNNLVRPVASVVLAASLLWMPVRYYGETLAVRNVPDARTALLGWIRTSGAKTLVLPFNLVPTLHYYYPDLQTTGYQPESAPATIWDSLNASPGRVLLCEKEKCDAVKAILIDNGSAQDFQMVATPVMEPDPDLQLGALFAVASQLPNR